MTADLTARVAELAAAIEAKLAEDEAAAKAVTADDWGDASAWAEFGTAVAVHFYRQDPARVLRRVRATRDLVAAILAEGHYHAEAPYYSCSQARENEGMIAEVVGPPGPPGSACWDEERAGKPCDCGRDAGVARLLGIIASEWEDGTDG